MIAHIQAEHPGYIVDAETAEYGRGSQLPEDPVAAMFISYEEELRITIPKENLPLKLILKTNITICGDKHKAGNENATTRYSDRKKRK